MKRIRGFIDLVFDVVEETTNLVERTHDAVVDRSVRRFAPVEPAKSTAAVVTGFQKAISSVTFESIRVVNQATRFAVNATADVAEAGLEQAVGPGGAELSTPIQSTSAGTASWYLDYAQASINGFWGDHLARKQSRLDLGMTLRHHGRHLPATREAFANAFPSPTPKLCVFVHSLASTEWLWSLSAETHYGDPDVTFGTRLRDDLGYTPIYLRYNTGLHISENGKRLARMLSEVLEAYPVPVDEIALVGHSMGGLVARSAAHYAREHDEPWAKLLRHVACIGSPHLGAPLEKAVNVLTHVLKRVDAAGAQVPAALLDGRSAGVKDLRYGYTIEEEWAGRDPDAVFADARRNTPLVDGVGYYFLAATISRDPEHPLGQLLGDLMVRLPSATGEHPEPARRIHFSGGAVFPGMNHIHIANHPDVYDALRDLLAA
jgi:pimeloyl-ACP methyl ester carboxylesterase